MVSHFPFAKQFQFKCIFFIDLKRQVDLQQNKLKESNHEHSELKIKLDEYIREKHASELELEESKLHSAQNLSEKEKILQVLQAENDKNHQLLLTNEQQIIDLKRCLRETEQQLGDIKTEFASYKVIC